MAAWAGGRLAAAFRPHRVRGVSDGTRTATAWTTITPRSVAIPLYRAIFSRYPPSQFIRFLRGFTTPWPTGGSRWAKPDRPDAGPDLTLEGASELSFQ